MKNPQLHGWPYLATLAHNFEALALNFRAPSLPQFHPCSAAGRSSKWPALAKRFLKEKKVCVISGMKGDLQIHHVKPFHLFPELELEWDNLRVITTPNHFLVGHGCVWKNYNENFDEHVRYLKEMIRQIKGK